MTTKQLVIIAIVLITITLWIVLQVGEDDINQQDIIGVVGFAAGAGFMVALLKGGQPK